MLHRAMDRSVTRASRWSWTGMTCAKTVVAVAKAVRTHILPQPGLP